MPKAQPAITDSRFALWRSAIAIAYADGNLDDQEKKLLLGSFPQRGFSEQQKQIIEKDMVEGVKLEEVFSGITDMRDRAHLINFARQLIQIDGKTNDEEQAAIDYISQHHSDKLNTSIELAAGKMEAQGLKNSYKAELKRQNSSDWSTYDFLDILDGF